MSDWKPDIYGYLDYRAYLADYYTAGKANARGFSYRYLARRAGFSSPNFFKLVIDGNRNLGADSIAPVCKALGLKSAEKRFFTALVEFAQANSAEERNAAFERLSASKRFREARRIEASMFDYLSHWYYPAIRELAGRSDFRNDAKWIGKQLRPKVGVRAVKQALATLLELGLLVETDGRLVRGEPSLTTGHEVRSLAIANFHREMLQRAAASIEEVDRELRDISALTVCVSEDLVPELKSRIHEFRETLLNLCDADDHPQVVYQMNFQLFPLSTGEEE